MHLLAAQPGGIADGSAAVDLAQSPGDMVVLSAADSELALLAQARARIADKDFPSLRLASLLNLSHNMSVDLYAEQVIAHARLVIVRLLGGRGYWPYGADETARLCGDKGIKLAFLSGDDQPDAELARLSTLGAEARHRLWQYLVHGGADNAGEFLRYAASLIGFQSAWREPRPLVRAGLYRPGAADADLETVRAGWRADAPVAVLVFYRALVQAGNTDAVDALIEGLGNAGLNALPVFVSSLRDPVAKATLEKVLGEAPPDVVLNATGFATAVPGAARVPTPFEIAHNGAPPPVVLQVIFAGSTEQSWRDGTRGLGARDIAMNVALPEVDGRIVGRAVSFKDHARRDALTETAVVRYRPVADRVAFVAELAARWARLRRKPPAERRIAIVLANYPNRDGRLANGVGLDTPAGAVNVLKALKRSGCRVEGMPADGAALVTRLLEGPTNDVRALPRRRVEETLTMADYQLFLRGLPEETQNAVLARWGAPEEDPYYQPGAVDCGRFAIPAFTLGNIAVCLQPARGYNIDPKSSYHDPALPPPHHYLAFHAWLRESFRADAVVHFGKHGNLEWLPGKALALSAECFPEAALGPMPNLYPFIVNDPGEGTQAKRRAQAVIVDHLTPPLTRAESYGPLRDLEQLVDEYYEASGVDPRRLKVLARDILELCRRIGLDSDCGIESGESETQALSKLDNYLCELKEMQIRDGLHVFGEAPAGRLLADTLVALARVPRNAGDPGGESLQRALANDLDLQFDPLDCVPAAPWLGPKPKALASLLADEPWRSAGDTVERIEAFAARLVAGEARPERSWTATRAVLKTIEETLKPAVIACGAAEIDGLLAGLAGGFVAPGPSGAPTRGRPDVLPTGRNFYSVDTRTVPTPAAWTLGWKSASLLVERHRQDHGAWPRTMALSAWGTANMRTGGDDIAQALALIGARPTWDAASRRVAGFEVLPASVLGRPRVDVTLRVSGFFRDAFPALIDLFDSASRAVAALDEDADVNPLAERVRIETAHLVETGVSQKEAARRAGFRVFGSKPGAYGAGLQALIDEQGWDGDDDLARAYVAWGGYAYGSGAEGEARHGLFEKRMAEVEAVVHNQDNREHDLLDSDDYYQFEGGLAVAVRTLSGTRPAVYHNDHSRPERPIVRTLADEIARVVRARVINPKWIKGVMRHGYKGAFEMAATVDYLFAFQATARCVADHHFDAVFDAYLADGSVRAFLEDANPAVLKEIAEKFLEAERRGLWRPRLNSAHKTLAALAAAA